MSVCFRGVCAVTKISYYLRHVHTYVYIFSAAHTGWIYLEFHIGDFYSNLFYAGQKYRALYMETKVHFIAAGEIKSM